MEIWDLYDEQGNKTGETWERSRAKEIPEGRYHIVCDILIRHQDGSFLLTLRDLRKEMYPGCWEASAGGSALAGETPEDCARREMLEETGLKAEKLELISVSYRPQSHSVLYAWLSVVNCQKEAVRLQEGETVDYRWMAPDSFLSLIKKYRPLVYICSPFSHGDVKENVRNARRYCRYAIEHHAIPFAPHLLFPQFMNDSNPAERSLAMLMNRVMLGKCDELWIFGSLISKGMKREIKWAKRKKLRICHISTDVNAEYQKYFLRRERNKYHE